MQKHAVAYITLACPNKIEGFFFEGKKEYLREVDENIICLRGTGNLDFEWLGRAFSHPRGTAVSGGADVPSADCASRSGGL
jgi:hypothetical protein